MSEPVQTDADRLRRLYGHLEWANRTVLARLRETGPDPGALRLFVHLVASETTWLARLDEPGLETEFADFWPDWTLDDCERAIGENMAAFRELVADEAGLERVVAYTNSKGQAHQNTVADILTHVAMHGSYHRGQVARAIRQAGGEPVLTDYIAWARKEGT